MTRWARHGSTQRHRKPPQDPTSWEEFAAQRASKPVKRKKREDVSTVSKTDDCSKVEVHDDMNSEIAVEVHHHQVKGEVIDDSSEPGINPKQRKKPTKSYDRKNYSQEQSQNQYAVENTGSGAKKHTEKEETDLVDGELPEKKTLRLKKSKTKLKGIKASTVTNSTSDTEKTEETVVSEGLDGSASVQNQQMKKMKAKAKRLEEIRHKRLQNGILLLPAKVEQKLYRIKKSLRKNGMSGEQIRQIMRRERRKEELKHRKTLKTCFNCRRVGHILSECPEITADVEQGTGICFKCGSTEHVSRNCSIETSEFPFAKCFICHEQGHLSRNCPKNEHGAYPKGGKCNLCGEIDHLKKDCPLLRKKKGEEDHELTADVITSLTSVDEIITKDSSTTANVHRKPKVVKF